MSDKNILIVLSDDGLASKAAEAFAQAGYSVSCEPEPDKAVETAKSNGEALVFFGFDDIDREFRFYDRLSGAYPGVKTILLKDKKLEEYLPKMIERRYMGNLIARNEGIEPRDLIVTAQKLLDGQIFGLERYIDAPKAEESFVISHSKQKDDAINCVNEFADSVGVEGRVIVKIDELLDETITNAIFNAPVDGRGFQKYRSVPRSEKVDLLNEEEVTVRCAADGDLLAVSVSDKFGSMNPMVTMLYLDRCLKLAKTKYRQITSDSTGGGMGLFRVYSAVNNLIFNIEVKKRTEVIALYSVNRRFRDFRSWNKSVHFFVQGDLFDFV